MTNAFRLTTRGESAVNGVQQIPLVGWPGEGWALAKSLQIEIEILKSRARAEFPNWPESQQRGILPRRQCSGR